jgi:hypothetical protein
VTLCFALLAPSENASVELRRRLESEEAAGGDVRDLKTMWIMDYHDPGCFDAHVTGRKPTVPDAETLPRAEWTTVETG